MSKNKIMVRLRRELSRTLVEPLILDSDIHLIFACLPQAGILKFGFELLKIILKNYFKIHKRIKSPLEFKPRGLNEFRYMQSPAPHGVQGRALSG